MPRGPWEQLLGRGVSGRPTPATRRSVTCRSLTRRSVTCCSVTRRSVTRRSVTCHSVTRCSPTRHPLTSCSFTWRSFARRSLIRKFLHHSPLLRSPFPDSLLPHLAFLTRHSLPHSSQCPHPPSCCMHSSLFIRLCVNGVG